MIIERKIAENIEKILDKEPKIILLYGPRQAGKTTLLNLILSKVNEQEVAFLMEKIKQSNNTDKFANFYFWRTYDQKEIDFIEEKDDNLYAYEIKWGEKEVKPPKDWVANYPKSQFSVITSENLTSFFEEK